ncbi:MAG: hypothetical protein NTZ83_01050 [Candidatus Pacearchaeota archaeon]|nr:hypothetical protein [Candidatus Pacearchaeota archaeon]
MGRNLDKTVKAAGEAEAAVKEFKKEVIEELEGWTPERFAQELYGNPHLPS